MNFDTLDDFWQLVAARPNGFIARVTLPKAMLANFEDSAAQWTRRFSRPFGRYSATLSISALVAAPPVPRRFRRRRNRERDRQSAAVK